MKKKKQHIVNDCLCMYGRAENDDKKMIHIPKQNTRPSSSSSSSSNSCISSIREKKERRKNNRMI